MTKPGKLTPSLSTTAVIVLASSLLWSCATVTTDNSSTPPADAIPVADSAVVQTASGLVQGVRAGASEAFKGIPYAAPEPDAVWDGIRSATAYGPACAQPEAASADCLTLNVWRPEGEPFDPWPVMVWIHGDSEFNNSGNLARVNSPAFAEQGVILVTLNYRPGAFGSDQPVSDVVLALEWVQQNIAAFGGDARRVTVFGAAAGADIVNTLLVNPSAEGLFQGAIAQSPTSAATLAAADQAHNVPYIVGANPGGVIEPSPERAEGESGAARICADTMAGQGAPVYRYYFSYVASDQQDATTGAAPTRDIAFVMRTLDQEPDLREVSYLDRKVSKLLSEYWVAFASNGQPNAYELPGWPAYTPDTRAVLDISDRPQVREE